MSDYKQLKQISKAALLEESTHLKLIMQGVITVGVLVISLVIWAAFATIKETAVTFGTIVPIGQVQVVQHLEGGTIRQVLVNDGDKVKKGQPLVIMDETTVQAELSEQRSREVALILNAERLRYFLDGKPANLALWSQKIIDSKYNTVQNAVEITKLLRDEESHLNSQYKKREDQISVLKATIQQRREKMDEVTKQKVVWEQHIDLLQREYVMYEKLRKGNLISHKDYLEVLREMNRAQGELVGLTSQIQQSKQAIFEAEAQLKETESDTAEKALQELGTVNDGILEVRHKIQRLEDQLARLKVRSPVDGLVKGVRVFAGNVVPPGGTLLEVVPLGQEMMVESRVEPRDIGHIKVGDKVTVKVLTYDFARYGSIDGILTQVSASTFSDKDGRPYYKATVELDKQYIGTKNNKKDLIAGMTVEASVVTGEKTLLQYLLKPIHRSAESAFRER